MEPAPQPSGSSRPCPSLSPRPSERALGQEGPRRGFEIEEFGGETILLRSVPAGCEGADPERLLREVLSDLREGERPAEGEARRRRVAASAACHAAIKVHFPLTIAKMAWLLDALYRCHTPTTCPHGRPTTLRVGREEIERDSSAADRHGRLTPEGPELRFCRFSASGRVRAGRPRVQGLAGRSGRAGERLKADVPRQG